MALTGQAVLCAMRTVRRDEVELGFLGSLLPHCGRGTTRDKYWDGDWLVCDYDRYDTPLTALDRLQRERYGRLSAGGVLGAPLLGADVVLIDQLRPLRRSDVGGLAPLDATIGSVVQIERLARIGIRFRCLAAEYPLAPRLATRFRRLCDALVFNYPVLLGRHSPPDVLEPRPVSDHVWSLVRTEQNVHLQHEPIAGVRLNYGVVTGRQDAVQVARQRGYPVVAFEPHPWIDGYVPLWQPRPSMQHPAADLAPDPRAMGRAEVADRLQRALELDPLKSLRISGWDGLNGRYGCPHCPTAESAGGTAFHIFWYCPAAQRIWTALRSRWQLLGLWTGSLPAPDNFVTAVFGLRLPCTPQGVWNLLPDDEIDYMDVSEVHHTLNVVWRLQILRGLQLIWRWRHSHYDASLWTSPTVDALAAAAWPDAWRRVHRSLASRTGKSTVVRILAAVSSMLPDEPFSVLPSVSDSRYVLFFDGGSCGNPGPGGAGAVVVRASRDGAATVVWSAAMSLAAAHTTTNLAEYFGLLTCLRAAHQHGWTPLEVVGDSLLVLRQMVPPAPQGHLTAHAFSRPPPCRPTRRPSVAPSPAGLEQDGRHGGQHRQGHSLQPPDIPPNHTAGVAGPDPAARE